MKFRVDPSRWLSPAFTESSHEISRMYKRDVNQSKFLLDFLNHKEAEKGGRNLLAAKIPPPITGTRKMCR